MENEIIFNDSYPDNVAAFDMMLAVGESFDIIRKKLCVGADELTLYFIDGFVKDTIMQRLMQFFLDQKSLPVGSGAAIEFSDRCVPYFEVDVSDSAADLCRMLLSGAAVILGSTFGQSGIIIDVRTYPARNTAEPQNDRVMLGAHDGFVETLIFNTALIRRRIRSTDLRVCYRAVGRSSQTDIAIVYMNGRADEKYAKKIIDMISSLDVDALPLGHQSLAESLIRHRWYNPFPKIRVTERPDAASAQILEGNVIIVVDNSPQVMILPTSIFDFLEESDDYYMPPLTGSYLRILRQVIFWLTLVLTPLWYLAAENPSAVPEWLSFVVPVETGRIPIIAQLFLTELIIDGLKLASLNTPAVFSNSLNVVAGLILGDFAVDIGWLIPEVILYMAFVAIANFSQPGVELGFAIKFLRMLLLALSALFGIWGFLAGFVVIIILISTNKTVNGGRNYLYPLIPFNGKAMLRHLVRVKKEK